MVQQFNKEIIMDSNFDIQSAAARILWAKTSSDNSLRWTPLYVHMRDSAEVCRKLWNEWVPNSVRHRVRSGITVDRNVCDDETAGRVAVFWPASMMSERPSPRSKAEPLWAMIH